jgi:hypothetical protein
MNAMGRPLDVNRVRQTVLDELRAAERDLTQMQAAAPEREPERARARDLSALRKAIASLVRLMPKGSDG